MTHPEPVGDTDTAAPLQGLQMLGDDGVACVGDNCIVPLNSDRPDSEDAPLDVA